MFSAVCLLLVALLQGVLASDSLPSSGIINGNIVPDGGAPYQVSLQNSNGNPYCGGSILTADWIVTAGHCLNWSQSFDVSKVYVRYNFLNLSSPQVDRVQVAKIYGDGWDESTLNNDIALLKLATPLKLGRKNAESIELVSEGYEPPVDAKLTVSGWGLTSNHAHGPSELLREVTLSVVSHQKCQEAYGKFKITTGMICAGGDGVHDACSMDSGGPAVIDGKLAGVVSFGSAPCATKGLPSGYANVAHYRKWIRQITGH